MRIFQLVIASSFALIFAIASGCGGNVVVDTGTGGRGGGSNNTGTTSVGQTGTSVATSTGTSTIVSVGTGMNPCDTQSCLLSGDGSCVCEVVKCNGQVFRSRCKPELSGAFCECSLNDMTIATCNDNDSVHICDAFVSCCGQFYPGG